MWWRDVVAVIGGRGARCGRGLDVRSGSYGYWRPPVHAMHLRQEAESATRLDASYFAAGIESGATLESMMEDAVARPGLAPTASANGARRSTAPTALLFMSWAHFLNDGASNYLPGVLPAVLAGFHIPVALVGTVMAALLIGQALQPFCGWPADEVGGRSFVLIGMAGSAVAAALVGVAPGYWSLLGVLLLVGIGNAMFHPQALAAIRELATLHGTGRHGLFMSTFLVGGELGRGTWPVVASLAVVALGLKSLVILALPAILTLPFIGYQLPILAGRRHRDVPKRVWWRRRRELGALISYASVRATVMYSLTTFLPLMWVERGGSLIGGASLVTTLLTVGIVGNLGGGHLADRFGQHAVIVGATVMSALFLSLFLLTTGPALWFILALLGVTLFATIPLQILIGQDILPENRSFGSGLALGFSNGLGAFAMIVLGVLADGVFQRSYGLTLGSPWLHSD
jgi:FSR family fosmidomycin resistance protein-like MFS transporter